MPGLKRVRRSPGSDDELSDGGSATDTSKRQRTSSPDRDDESDDNDDNGDLSDGQLERYTETQLARRNEDNQANENGIIEEITMVNFMCHDHLTIKVGPLINFIIGHNGSGKSAALTALTLSLGGKVSATNRGATLKNFIKNDKDQATLIVKIKNAGDNSYRPDEYGDLIIIERQFSRAGSSGFKLKSQAGRIISTKKADVDDITDHYGLQMDNPLTVLTQDKARSFISQALPAETYSFFIKGVQLEQLEHDYILISEQLDILSTTYDERESYLVQLEEELNKAKDNYRATSRLQDLRDKLEMFRMKMVWCQVVSQERKEESLRKDLDTLQAEIQAAHEEFEAAGQLFADADTARDDLQVELKNVQDELQPILEHHATVQDTHERLKAESSHLQKEQRISKDQLKHTKEKIAKKQKEIAEEEKRLEERNGSSYAQRMQQLEEKKTAASDADSRAKQHADAGPALKTAISDAQNVQKRHKSARGPLAEQVEETEKRLRGLTANNSRNGIYDPKMSTVLKAIKQDTGFRKQPIGPMGDYVQLKKPTWSSVLEKFFGNALNGFVVSSKEDQERLTGIMRRLSCSFPISIVNETQLDYRGHEPPPEYDTVLRVLEVEHPLIVKYMVINHNVEQVILIENIREARDLMFGPRIKNVKACFSLSHNDSTTGERFAYGISGVSTSFADGYRGRPRMKAPIKDHIEHEKQVLRQQQEALREHDEKLIVIRADIERATHAHTKHVRDNADLRAAANQAAEEATELQDLIDQDVSNQGRLDELKIGLADLESDKTKQQETFQQCIVALDAVKARRADDLRRSNEAARQVEEAQQRVGEVEVRLREAETTRANALIKKNEIDDDIKHKEHERDNDDGGLLKSIHKVKALITNFITQASEYGPRVPVAENETMESIQAAFGKTQKNIEDQEKKLGGSIAQLRAAFETAQAKYNSAKQQLKDDKELQQILTTSLNSRRERWRDFRRHITTRARLNFNHLLTERSFRGELRVDHKAKLLDIVIQPDETQVGKGKRAAKTLSGGEKSFSQICLIVALWEAIGAPIRCLDEFDVFMDSVNRNLAMKILVDAARNSHGRQFILITPQSMSSLADGPDIKVHKMRDPDRTGGQTTLPFAG